MTNPDPFIKLSYTMNRAGDIPCMLIVTVLFVSGGCRCGDREDPASKADGAQTEKTQRWPRPRVIWRTPHGGQLWPLAADANRVVVAAFDRAGRHIEADHLAAFSLDKGKLSWKTNRLLAPALLRRSCIWSFSHAMAHRKGKHVFAFLRSQDRVTALDVKTGKRLWTKRSRHGVIANRGKMVISDGLTLKVLNPLNGKVARVVDLSRQGAGAAKGGLKAGLKRWTTLQSLAGLVLMTRRDGGDLQALDPQKGTLSWQLSTPHALSRRVLSLPRSDDVLLVPIGYPDPRPQTRLWAWNGRIHSGDPQWKGDFSGRLTGRRIWFVAGKLVVLRTAITQRQSVLVLNPKTGRPLHEHLIPTVESCQRGPGQRLFCRRGGQVFALDIKSGRRVWYQTVGAARDALRRIWTVDDCVIAVTAHRIWVIAAQDGRVRWRIPKVLENTEHGTLRITVDEILGQADGQLVAVLHHHAKDPAKERIYLAGLKRADGKLTYLKKLGKPIETDRKSRLSRSRKKLLLPVHWVSQGGRKLVFSALGRFLRLYRADNGQRIKDYRLPGDPTLPIRSLGVVKTRVYLEKGTQLFAVELATLRPHWKKNISDKEVTCLNANEVFLRDTQGRISRISPSGAFNLPEPLRELLQKIKGTVLTANAKTLTIKGAKATKIIARGRGKILAQTTPNLSFRRAGPWVIGLQRSLQPAEKTGAYVAVDPQTGKQLWRKEVSKKKFSLPAPILAERRWPVAWVRAAGKQFVTTDPLGKCVIAIRARDGHRKWRVCFEKLVGYPLNLAPYLLVAAQGVPLTAAQAAEHPSAGRALGDRDAIYAIRLADGKVKKIFTPADGKHIRLGLLVRRRTNTSRGISKIPRRRATRDRDGPPLIIAVESPSRKALQHNKLIALDPW